jgi:hypothetical protein
MSTTVSLSSWIDRVLHHPVLIVLLFGFGVVLLVYGVQLMVTDAAKSSEVFGPPVQAVWVAVPTGYRAIIVPDSLSGAVWVNSSRGWTKVR